MYPLSVSGDRLVQWIMDTDLNHLLLNELITCRL